NPNRPKGRVRFSVAHEIAHTLFPDYQGKVHHRIPLVKATGDEWQLEALCNLAAAELLMPVGSLEDVPDNLTIDDVLRLRKDFDVSVEAALIRAVNVASHEVAMFSVSSVERGEEGNERYIVDYSVGSAVITSVVKHGLVLPEGSVVEECSAIGYT